MNSCLTCEFLQICWLFLIFVDFPNIFWLWFQLYSTLVRKCILWDISLLKFVRICFIAQYPVNFGKCSIVFWKNVAFECRVLYRPTILIVIFISIINISFCFGLLIVIEKVVLRLLPISIHFSLTLFCQLLLHILQGFLLGTYTLFLFNFLLADHFIIMKIILTLSLAIHPAFLHTFFQSNIAALFL